MISKTNAKISKMTSQRRGMESSKFIEASLPREMTGR